VRKAIAEENAGLGKSSEIRGWMGRTNRNGIAPPRAEPVRAQCVHHEKENIGFCHESRSPCKVRKTLSLWGTNRYAA